MKQEVRYPAITLLSFLLPRLLFLNFYFVLVDPSVENVYYT